MRHPAKRHHLSRAGAGLAITALALAVPSLAHEAVETTPDPGFRPQSPYAAEFVESAGTATIAVLPSIVRRAERTAHSFNSQDQIVVFLNKTGIGTPVTKSRRVDLGPLRRPSQWEIFQYGAETVASELQGHKTGADYTLVMEFLVPDQKSVFGIEIYVLDRNGQNAFSFLLNAHHEMFADAKLLARNSSEDARQAMITDATRVGLMALKAQIEKASDCIAATAANTPTRASTGILHDFETELVANTNDEGIQLGFSTFTGGNSTVSIQRSNAHPEMPGEEKANHVLELDLEVTGWAGTSLLFTNS
ncbi:MAG: hypothetical protein KJP16_09910, partial [Gammaproteobacteria bacterium]|nr:hypothetical protein [Gammaproteobacteria bacterium]NNL51121.1 hypothetical protein [Woeseiaceae bacterium]